MSEHRGLEDGIERLSIEMGAPFIVEVQETGHTDWIRNAQHFATVGEARSAGIDLFSRWLGISDWRIVDTRNGAVIER